MSTKVGSFWEPPPCAPAHHYSSYFTLLLSSLPFITWSEPSIQCCLETTLCQSTLRSFVPLAMMVHNTSCVFLRPIFPVFPLMPFWSLMKNLNHISISKLFSFIQRKPPTQFQSLYLKEIFKWFFAHQPFVLQDWKYRKKLKLKLSCGSVRGFQWSVWVVRSKSDW